MVVVLLNMYQQLQLILIYSNIQLATKRTAEQRMLMSNVSLGSQSFLKPVLGALLISRNATITKGLPSSEPCVVALEWFIPRRICVCLFWHSVQIFAAGRCNLSRFAWSLDAMLCYVGKRGERKSRSIQDSAEFCRLSYHNINIHLPFNDNLKRRWWCRTVTQTINVCFVYF